MVNQTTCLPAMISMITRLPTLSLRGRATNHGKLLMEGAYGQSIHTMLWLLTGQGDLVQTAMTSNMVDTKDSSMVDTNRRGAVMLVLALEVLPSLLHPVLTEVSCSCFSDPCSSGGSRSRSGGAGAEGALRHLVRARGSCSAGDQLH